MSNEPIFKFSSGSKVVEFDRVWPSPIDSEPPVFYLTIRPNLEDESGNCIALTPDVVAQFVEGFNKAAVAKDSDLVVYEESFR